MGKLWGKNVFPFNCCQNRTEHKRWRIGGKTHIPLKSEFKGTFFNLSVFRRDGFKRYHACNIFFYIFCVNHPVQQSQATFSPSLHVADLENKSFHRFSASRQEIPFEYILKGNANVSRIEMISTIFQPKKTFSNSSFDPLPLDRLVPTSKPPSLNAKTRVQKGVSGLLWTQTIRYWKNGVQ